MADDNENTDSPWTGIGAQLEQMGVDPNNISPVDVQQALALRDALASRDHRDYALSQVLGGELPEGMTWAEAKAAISTYQAEQQSDPYEDLLSGEYDPTPEPQPQFDPNAIRQAVQSDVQRQMEQERQRLREEMLQERQVAEFNTAVSRIAQENNLSPEDQQILVAQAAARAQAPGADSASPAEHVTGAWDTLSSWRSQAAQAQLNEQLNSNPGTSTPEGVPAEEGEAPPMNIDEAEALAERIRAGEYGG